jgi:hypothetical protein
MQRLGSQRLYHGLTSMALVGGLMAGSTSGGLGGLLGGLLGTGTNTPTASSSTALSGHLDMPSQRLRQGCRKYTYQYVLHVPDGTEFDLEIFVTDPRGISQASDVILSGADPLRGSKYVTICRSNTEPGRFVLHGTLYTNDGQGPTTTTKVPDDPFRLTVPHRHKKRHHRT